MIKGKCFTNLDEYDCSKVKIFCALPNIGDKVMVFYKGKYTTLRICAITHDVLVGEHEEPFIRVELNK